MLPAGSVLTFGGAGGVLRGKHIGRKAELSEVKGNKSSIIFADRSRRNAKCHLRGSQWQIQTLAGPDVAGDRDALVTCHRTERC